MQRAGSRVRTQLVQGLFGRDVGAEVHAELQALHVALAEAVRDLGEDLREGLRSETLRRTDLLLERLDRKVEGLFAGLSTQETLGSFFRGDAYLEFKELGNGDHPAPGRIEEYAMLFPRGPVADLACGRGDFLVALRQAGVDAYGLEIGQTMVDGCRARGVTALQEQGLEHLAGLEEGTLGGIAALHLVEHLSPSEVEQLLLEAARVLVPAGLMVIETPNPTSVWAYLNRFLRDPTHRWAIHPDTLAFMARKANFVLVDLRFFSSRPDDEGEGTADGLKELLYGPETYALIAKKPGA